MKVLFDSVELKKALGAVGGTVSGNPKTPALSNVLIEIDDGRATFITSDIANTTTATIDVGCSDTGSILLPFARLRAVINRAHGSQVAFDVDGHAVNIESGRIKARLIGSDPDTFPSIPDIEYSTEFECPAGEFLEGLEFVTYSIGTDEGRPHLMGAHLRTKGDKLMVESTDGYKLTQFVYEFGVDCGDEKGVKALISREAVLATIGALKGEFLPIKVRIGESGTSIVSGNVCIQSRALDGNYPDTDNVIPSRSGGWGNTRAEILIDRKIWETALADVATVVNKTTQNVRAEVKGDRLALYASNDDGSMDTEIAISRVHGAIDAQFGFNLQYVMAALKTLGTDDVRLSYQDGLRPLVFRKDKDDDDIIIVMPMRL